MLYGVVFIAGTFYFRTAKNNWCFDCLHPVMRPTKTINYYKVMYIIWEILQGVLHVSCKTLRLKEIIIKLLIIITM